jgi:Flp pilus assembly pilin Flp
MQKRIRWVAQRTRSVRAHPGEAGQGLVEYGMILSLVALLCLTALGVLQGGVAGALQSAGTMF